MMTCLIELSGTKRQGPDSFQFHIKIQSNLSTVRLLYGQYQKLYKGNESERRNLEQLKGQLDTLHQKMLRDQELSQTLTNEAVDLDGSISKGEKLSSFTLFFLLFFSVSVALSTCLAIQTKERKESALTNLCD